MEATENINLSYFLARELSAGSQAEATGDFSSALRQRPRKPLVLRTWRGTDSGPVGTAGLERMS